MCRAVVHQVMRCSHCQRCCQETEMELCSADIDRLERRGHSRGDFCYTGVDGITRLRNVGVWCFFYDPEKKRCREYASRPLGCALYPVNISEDGDIVIDGLCPMADTISEKERRLKGERLVRLLDTIDAEAGRSRG